MTRGDVVPRKDSIYKALFEFQKNAPDLVKTGRNPHFGNQYVPLEQVVERVLPALHEQGILVLQPTSSIGEKSALSTILFHVPTETFVDTQMPLELDKVTPQGQGSAITYARRYALLALLGLVGDADDDAQRAETATVRNPSSTEAGRRLLLDDESSSPSL